jgi:hypothetical protein
VRAAKISVCHRVGGVFAASGTLLVEHDDRL